jgi:drug/metabolite transporter (DMT)-like permease
MQTSSPAASGFALALGAAIAFGLNITFARLAADAGIAAPVLLAYRVALLTAFTVVAALVFRQSLDVPQAERKPLILLGLGSAVVGMCYLSSITFIPIAVAAVVFYTFPVLIVLASPFVDGRRLTAPLLGVVLLAFLGIVLVIGPGFGGLDPRGLLLAAGASLGAVLQFFAGTRCGTTTTIAKVFWVQMIVLPIALLITLLTGGFPGVATLALAPLALALTIAGFIIGFVLQIVALARVSAVAAGIAFCIEPVIAAATAALILGETLEPLQYVGGALVLAAIVANVIATQNREGTAAAV